MRSQREFDIEVPAGQSEAAIVRGSGYRHVVRLRQEPISGTLVQVVFDRCDFSAVQFSRVRLESVLFIDCQLGASVWSDSDLSDVLFANCQMADSQFVRCQAQDVVAVCRERPSLGVVEQLSPHLDTPLAVRTSAADPWDGDRLAARLLEAFGASHEGFLTVVAAHRFCGGVAESATYATDSAPVVRGTLGGRRFLLTQDPEGRVWLRVATTDGRWLSAQAALPAELDRTFGQWSPLAPWWEQTHQYMLALAAAAVAAHGPVATAAAAQGPVSPAGAPSGVPAGRCRRVVLGAVRAQAQGGADGCG